MLFTLLCGRPPNAPKTRTSPRQTTRLQQLVLVVLVLVLVLVMVLMLVMLLLVLLLVL